MINSVRLCNFKACRDLTTPLRRLSVFVGPNASGKTSILEGVHFAAQAGGADVSRIFTGRRSPNLIFSGLPGEIMSFELHTQLAALLLQIKTLDASNDAAMREDLVGQGWQIVTPRGGNDWAFLRLGRSAFEPSRSDWVSWNDLKAGTQQELGKSRKAVLLRLNAAQLASPSYVAQEVPRVEFDGEGLASTLLYMKGNSEETFEQLENELRSLVPSVKKIRFRKARVYQTEVEYLEREGRRTSIESQRSFMGDALTFDTTSGSGVPAELMSEGTLLLLGMLAVLHGPLQPQLVLIDDLDRALHPKAQRMLVELLHKLLDARNDLQIVATSHSPYLLDSLASSEIGLTALNSNGAVVCAPLEKHPDYPKWKDEMSPGEFWSLVGEEWVRQQSGAGAGA